MNEVANAISAIANFLIAGSAIAGAIIGAAGLTTWKSQIKYQTDSNISKEILKTLYRHRDAIASVRHPAIWSSETDEALRERKNEIPENPEARRYQETEAVYQKRWERVAKVRSEIYPLMLEADVIWGEQLRSISRSIFDLEIELKIVIENFLRASNPLNSEDARNAAENFLRKKRDIMYDSLGEDDQFGKDYAAAFEPIEKYLRAKLGVH